MMICQSTDSVERYIRLKKSTKCTNFQNSRKHDEVLAYHQMEMFLLSWKAKSESLWSLQLW